METSFNDISAHISLDSQISTLHLLFSFNIPYRKYCVYLLIHKHCMCCTTYIDNVNSLLAFTYIAIQHYINKYIFGLWLKRKNICKEQRKLN